MKTKIPTDSDQLWEWVKYQLRMRGSSLALVAQDLGISRQSVINAKRVRYPRVERAIARKLDMAPRDIWPDRWHPDGAPVRERPNMGERKHNRADQHTKSNAIAHCQMARSA
jgi:Ner family transcriptional regulator